jgi:succinate-semialdehyde dehydrogenase / glutarate-semialdehyde dehydrogenase
MMQNDDALAIPLWINGHAYLTLAPGFLDVRNPASGELLRRTPLCDAATAQQAVAAAAAAVAAWAARPAAERATLLGALGEALAAYAAHFARLIVDESGVDGALAAAEVAATVALLRSPPTGAVSAEVLAVVARSSLLLPLQLAIPALMAGATLVLRPLPQAPSAIFALAELSGRCAFPGGVLNVLHGGEDVVAALRDSGIRLLSA